MGLLDKVKAQATAATEMAKDAAAKGQAKLDEAQAKKAADPASPPPPPPKAQTL